VTSRRFLDNTEPGLERFWHPVALADELGDAAPLGVSVAGKRWVIVRLGGQLTALRDVCPHRLAPLSAGAIIGDTLQCPYHGFRFASDGRCVEIPSNGPDARVPAKADATRAFGVTERYGLIWLAPEEPVCDIIDVPEWNDPAFTCWYLAPRRTHISAALLTDNFIDAGHFPYLHKDTFGAVDSGRPQLTAQRDGWRLRVVNSGQPNSGLNYGTAEALQVYEVGAPFSLRIAVTLAHGARNTFLFFVQPESATSSRLYVACAYDDVQAGTELFSEVTAFNDKVLDEDVALLDRYPDPRMPIDLTSELHTRADLGTVEFRRMAAQIPDLVANP
jgi:phenylpropionate dioxygenase-like ring-hydroxylating dioxygenase large terminal subunit